MRPDGTKIDLSDWPTRECVVIWMWTWRGKCFGYLDGGDLYTHSGKHVGKLQGTEIYNSQGHYIGEVMNQTWLITCQAKKGWRGYAFTPNGNQGAYSPYSNYAGYSMYAGYEDFPDPKSF